MTLYGDNCNRSGADAVPARAGLRLQRDRQWNGIGRQEYATKLGCSYSNWSGTVLSWRTRIAARTAAVVED